MPVGGAAAGDAGAPDTFRQSEMKARETVRGLFLCVDCIFREPATQGNPVLTHAPLHHMATLAMHGDGNAHEGHKKRGGNFLTDTLKLQARMDLAAAQKLVSDLSEADLSKPLTLDASDVEHLGALCVQAIIAAARGASSSGGSFKIENISERVETQLATMGLSGEALMEGAV